MRASALAWAYPEQFERFTVGGPRLGDETADTRQAISATSTAVSVTSTGYALVGGAAGATAAFGAGTAAALGAVAAVAPYVAAVALIAMVVFSMFDSGPSQAWITFPTRLRETLTLENEALQTLAHAIVGAQSEADLLAAIAAYHATVGQRVGGFAAGVGPWEIVTPPGATGTAHEGRIVANFGEVTDRIRDLLAAKRQELAVRAGASPSEVGAPGSPSWSGMSSTTTLWIIAAGLGGLLLVREL